jgi:uncharacterized membrane protein
MLPTLIIAAFLIWFFAGRHIPDLRNRLAKAEAAISELEAKLQDTRAELPPEANEQEGPQLTAPEVAEEIPPQAEPSPAPTSVPITPAQSEPAPGAPEAAATTAPSFEERVGTRWAVWVGGAALAVGGIFLVNYSIEAGLIGPTTRIVLGTLFALALIGAGEWMRRGERELPIDIVPAAHIPGILTAAGTVALFGTIYAAYALYGLIGTGTAFVLLGAAGLTAMLASALHGPALAGLGLVGAMVTPLLVSSSDPNPWPLVIFLAVVSASAFVLARVRHWLWLALASVAGVVLWGLALAQPIGGTWESAAFVHALIQLGLTVAFFAVEPHVASPDTKSKPDIIAGGALAALTLLVVWVLATNGMRTGSGTEWGLFAAIAIALLAGTAWLSAPSAAAAVFAGIVTIAVAFLWDGVDAPAPASNLWPAVGAVLRLPDELHVYFPFIAVASLGVAFIAALRLRVGRDLPTSTAGLYALAATMTPLMALTVAYLRITQFDSSIPFALFGLVLALVFADAANRFQNDEGEPPATAPHLGAGAFAAAAIAALSFALVVWLDRGYLTVALALSALGTSYVSTLKRIPMLRYAVAALGVVVLGRIVWDPAIMGADVGRFPILNWLLVGYGVPAACFALAAKLLRAEREDFAVHLADSLAVIFSGLLAFFEIRHLVHGGDPLAYGSSFLEQGLMTFMSLGFAAALLKLDLGRANPVFRAASYAFGLLAGFSAVFGLGLAENPYLFGGRISGGWLINDLIPGYLLPALMALYLARASRGVRARWYTVSAAALAFLLVFLYVTLSVRHLFHGADIAFNRGTTDAEQWACSVAWLALGLAFLAYGVWRSSPEARLASGILVLLVTLKVFLFDLSGIGGLWRALSFICLGLVLIGIGLAYQRLLFARPRPDEPAPLPAPGSATS